MQDVVCWMSAGCGQQIYLFYLHLWSTEAGNLLYIINFIWVENMDACKYLKEFLLVLLSSAYISSDLLNDKRLTFGRVNNWFGRYLYFILWNLMSMVFHQGWYFVSFRSGCYSWSVIYYFKESISNFWISNHSDLRKVASKYIYQQNLCWGWVCNILRNNPRC